MKITSDHYIDNAGISDMVKIPVYFDLNGIHQISIFQEQDDGTFRRTTEQPMRLLRESIEGIGPSVGEIVSSPYDREDRIWQTPTVMLGHRPASYYQFLREQLKSRKIYVFARASMNTRVNRLQVHELKLKPGVSMQVQSLLARKLVEAIDLDLEHETQEQEVQESTIVA